MLLARVSRIGISPNVAVFLKTPVVPRANLSKIQVSRYASDGRTGVFTRSAKSKTALGERILSPAGEGAFTVGRGAVAGSAALGIGALCYYGLGLSSAPGAIDRSVLWPQYVRDRIKATYGYFGASIIVSALSAAMCLRSPTVMNLVMRQGIWALAGTMVAMIGTGIVARSLPYQEGVGIKQLAWLTHCGVNGAVLAPLAFLGGPILIRAAWYTTAVVGGLSAVAMCAPSDKFLNMGGPLAIGLGVVFASSVGSAFLPPTTALGAGMHSIALYGGLILFSMFLLYDTQKIIARAESHPIQSSQPYDPINNSIGIYLDTMNIFIRIAMMLTGGNNKKR